MMSYNGDPDFVMNLSFHQLVKEVTESLCTRRYTPSLKEELKKKVNMVPYVYSKERLLKCLLTNDKLSCIIRIRVMDIIMDEHSQEFSFFQPAEENYAGPRIMQILYQNCLEIKTLDLTSFYIRSTDRELFENLFIKFTQLETVRVKMRGEDCAVYDILLGDSIRNNNERRVNNTNRFVRCLTNMYNKMKTQTIPVERVFEIPIEKIDRVDLCRKVPPEICARLLRLLPNVESLGNYNKLGKVITLLQDNECMNFNLTYLQDNNTSVKTLFFISKHCTNLNRIRLFEPQKKTVRNLHLLPSITKLDVSYFYCYELTEYVINYGMQLRELRLYNGTGNIDLNCLMDSCLNLSHLLFYDVSLKYVAPKEKIIYPKIRSIYLKRVYSSPSFGIKNLLYCLPNIEHIDVDDVHFNDRDVENMMKLNLWENIKTLSFSCPFNSNYNLTIQSLILILTQCKYLEEIKNIDHFLVDPSNLSKILRNLQN